jgi:hypothetical protein
MDVKTCERSMEKRLVKEVGRKESEGERYDEVRGSAGHVNSRGIKLY